MKYVSDVVASGCGNLDMIDYYGAEWGILPNIYNLISRGKLVIDSYGRKLNCVYEMIVGSLKIYHKLIIGNSYAIAA